MLHLMRTLHVFAPCVRVCTLQLSPKRLDASEHNSVRPTHTLLLHLSIPPLIPPLTCLSLLPPCPFPQHSCSALLLAHSCAAPVARTEVAVPPCPPPPAPSALPPPSRTTHWNRTTARATHTATTTRRRTRRRRGGRGRRGRWFGRCVTSVLA
jgi:hypothetical protein